MTISVGELFCKAGLKSAGVVPWRTPVPLNVPGVYVVASTPSLDDAIGRVPAYRPEQEAFRSLRKLCPNPTIDGVEASDQELADRIGAYWIRETPILYVGLAGTSVRKRVGQYYATDIGKRSPHAGGWWLKTLADLENLYVHYAAASDPDHAETHLLSVFAASVPATVKEALHDNERIAPFANIDAQRGVRKRHGLQGVKMSRIPVDVTSTSTVEEKKPSFESEAIVTGRNEKTAEHGAVRIESQVITEGDRTRSNLRIPSRSKYALPANDGHLNVIVRGVSFQARWRVNGSRSGTIGLGNDIMRTLGTTAKSVWLRVLPDAVIVED